MIEKKSCHCTLHDKMVDALVDTTRRGRGKNAETVHSVMRCLGSAKCDKASYCRFVNPLTTRNPLEVETVKSGKAAG